MTTVQRQTTGIMLFLLFLAPLGWQGFEVGALYGSSEEVIQPVKYFLEVEKSENFLANPATEPLEVLRRLGRGLHLSWVPWSQHHLTWVGLASTTLPFDHPVPLKSLDPKQQQEFFVFRESVADMLPASSTRLLSSGMRFFGVVDVSNLDTSLNLKPGASKPAGPALPERLAQIQSSIEPFMKIMERGILEGFLDSRGLSIRVELLGGKDYPSAFPPHEQQRTLTLGRFMAPDAVVSAAQLHINPEPDVFLKNLEKYPQTSVIQSYLASAGLDLKNDLLANPAVESLLHLSLDPIGEAGLPDIRFVARIKDLLLFTQILPKLKNLASTLGVFVTLNQEPYPFVRISYFLYPSFGVSVSLVGDLLIITSGPVPLQKMVERIQRVSDGKDQPFPTPADCQRFWRVHFQDLNRSLQKFLQSPLLAGKGIPPLTNLTIADELEDLELTTRMHADRIAIHVRLPIRGAPGK